MIFGKEKTTLAKLLYRNIPIKPNSTNFWVGLTQFEYNYFFN